MSSSHPRPGWVEQDPEELLETAKACIEVTVENLKKLEGERGDLQGGRGEGEGGRVQ